MPLRISIVPVSVPAKRRRRSKPSTHLLSTGSFTQVTTSVGEKSLKTAELRMSINRTVYRIDAFAKRIDRSMARLAEVALPRPKTPPDLSTAEVLMSVVADNFVCTEGQLRALYDAKPLSFVDIPSDEEVAKDFIHAQDLPDEPS